MPGRLDGGPDFWLTLCPIRCWHGRHHGRRSLTDRLARHREDARQDATERPRLPRPAGKCPSLKYPRSGLNQNASWSRRWLSCYFIPRVVPCGAPLVVPWVVPRVAPLVVLPVTLWLSRGCPVYLLGSIRAPSPGRNTKIHHPHNQQEPGEVMRRGAEHERERKRCGEEPNMRERERERERESERERKQCGERSRT